MNSNLKYYWIGAGIAGFIAGVLVAPDKGTINRLQLQKKLNKMANKALNSIENMQQQLEAGN